MSMLGNFMRKLSSTQSAPPDKELLLMDKTIQNIQQRVNLLRNNIHKWNEYQCLISELGLLISNDFAKLYSDNSPIVKKLQNAQVIMTSRTHQTYKAQIADYGGLAQLERWADTAAELLEELGEVNSVRNVAYEAKMKLESAKSGGRTSVLGIGSSQQHRPGDLQRMESKYKSLVQAFRGKKKEFLLRAKEFEAQQNHLQMESLSQFVGNQQEIFESNFQALRPLQDSADIRRKEHPTGHDDRDFKEGDRVEVQIIAGVNKGRWLNAIVTTPPTSLGIIGVAVKEEELNVVNPSTFAPLICVRKRGFRGSDHSLPSVALSLPESIQDVKRYENVLPCLMSSPPSPVKPSPPKKQAPQKKHLEPVVPVQNVVHSTPVQLNIESDSPQPPPRRDDSTADLLGWGSFLSTNTLPETQQANKTSPSPNDDEAQPKASSSKKELSPNILGSFFSDLPTNTTQDHETNFLHELSSPGADEGKTQNRGSRNKPNKGRGDSFMSNLVRDSGASVDSVGFISPINENRNAGLNEFDPFGFEPAVAKSKPSKASGRSQQATVSQIGEDMMKNFGNKKEDKFSEKERREINLAVEKKVREFNEERRNEKAIEVSRQDAFERLDPRIRVWEYQDDHTRRNIRNLLSTLEQILWENSGWKGCSLSELLSYKGVKKHYRKAIMIVHPDKHQKASLEVQVVCERAFEALNEQWKSFEREVGQNN